MADGRGQFPVAVMVGKDPQLVEEDPVPDRRRALRTEAFSEQGLEELVGVLAEVGEIERTDRRIRCPALLLFVLDADLQGARWVIFEEVQAHVAVHLVEGAQMDEMVQGRVETVHLHRHIRVIEYLAQLRQRNGGVHRVPGHDEAVLVGNEEVVQRLAVQRLDAVGRREARAPQHDRGDAIEGAQGLAGGSIP